MRMLYCTKSGFISLLILFAFIPTPGISKPVTIPGIQQQTLLPLKDIMTNSSQTKAHEKFSALNKPNDPIAAFGHGQFFGTDGKIFLPTPESINEVQAYYLTKISEELRYSKNTTFLKEVENKKILIYQSVGDKVLANALFLDVLLEQSTKSGDKQLHSILGALRHAYIDDLMDRDVALKNDVFSKGIQYEIATKLEDAGVTVFLKTTASGDDYINECRKAGVPIPSPMYDEPWENRGIFNNEFVAEEKFAELWFYESKDPEGACLALPRYDSEEGERAKLLGLICLGKQSSKACFWDNPRGTSFERDEPVDITEFVGGAALVGNNQGTCTACHAGENPFVVHPDKPPFQGLSQKLQPDNWHDPLVHPDWPQNPGPTNILDTISSSERCDSCHQQGISGRFPDVSDSRISSYCNVVLKASVFGGVKRTMPQGGDIWGYFNHIDTLLSACFGNDVEIDPIPDDNSFISPPIIIDPLYACATKLAVRGTLLDAIVTVYINGFFVDSKTSRSPSQLDFDVPALQVGDVVTAIQKFDGVVSDPSDPVSVRDHKVDYPEGLPKPEINPTLIYECGKTIAVRHVPGAQLTVFVNGADPRSSSTSTGWTAIYPGKRPFDLGDKFSASIELCEDTSPLSDNEIAVAAPGLVNAPTFDPPTTYTGQELIKIENILHGSVVDIGEFLLGEFDKFSTPISWYSEYDFATPLGSPLSAGDQLYAQQTLCKSGPPAEVPTPQNCEEIPAPKIRIPLDGEDYVILTESVPGARIHVYDSINNELGDGSGNIIALNRTLVVGEEITVTQSIADCKGKFGYTIKVSKIERKKEG